MMSSTSQPTVSATICASTVSEPVPMSVAPISRLNEPSSFILSDGAAHVDVRDGGALHGQRDADAPPQVRLARHSPPSVMAVLLRPSR